MSILNSETLGERIRFLGSACCCPTCRGSDTAIEAVIGSELTSLREQLAKLQELARQVTTVNMPYIPDGYNLRFVTSRGVVSGPTMGDYRRLAEAAKEKP